MRGMSQLLELRRKGYKPACAYVFDDSSWLVRVHSDEWHMQGNAFSGGLLFANIQIEAEEMPERIDFRPLRGLEVHILGFRGDGRTFRLYEAIKRSEPSLLAAQMSDGLRIYKREDGDGLFFNR